jgi:hypothetical protein
VNRDRLVRIEHLEPEVDDPAAADDGDPGDAHTRLLLEHRLGDGDGDVRPASIRGEPSRERGRSAEHDRRRRDEQEATAPARSTRPGNRQRVRHEPPIREPR